VPGQRPRISAYQRGGNWKGSPKRCLFIESFRPGARRWELKNRRLLTFSQKPFILEDVPGWNRAPIDAGIATNLKVINLPDKIQSPGST